MKKSNKFLTYQKSFNMRVHDKFRTNPLSFEPGGHKVHVVFERDGSEVEALLAKFKTHLYTMVEEKYIVERQNEEE